MAAKGVRYTPEFKRQMVDLVRSGRSSASLRKEFGRRPSLGLAHRPLTEPAHRISGTLLGKHYCLPVPPMKLQGHQWRAGVPLIKGADTSIPRSGKYS